MNKILLFLIIFLLIISAGIYFYIHSSLLVDVIPNIAPLTKKETLTIAKEKNHRFIKEKTIIQNNLKNLEIQNFISSQDGSTAIALFKDNQTTLEEDEFIIVNEKRHKRYQSIDKWNILITPDGKNITYKVIESKGSRENEFIVFNGEEGKRYFGVTNALFSPDGQHYVYEVREYGNKQFIVLDDKEGPKYDMISDVVFSPNSQNILYKGTRNYKPFLVLNNEIVNMEKYDTIRPFYLFTPNNEIMYEGYKKAEDAIFLVIGKKEIRFPHDIIGAPVFSPDKNAMAYKSINKERDFVAAISAGNKIQAHQEAYKEIGNLVFSPDSKNLSYAACDGEKCFLVINDNREKKYFDKINDIVWSPDSKNFAYTVIKNDEFDSSTYENKISGEFVVINQKEGKHYLEADSLIFGPDSQTVAYKILSGDPDVYARFLHEGGADDLKNELRESIIVNNIEGEKYLMVTAPVFLNDGALRYFAYDGDNIYKITETVNSKIDSGSDMIKEKFQPLTQEAQKNCASVKRENKPQLQEEKTKVKEGLKNQEIDELYVSSDGNSLAYVLTEKFEKFLVINDCVSEKYDGVSFISFTPEVYVAEDRGKEFVVLNGKKQNEYDRIDGLFYNPPSLYNLGLIYKGDSFHYLMENLVYTAEEKNKKFVVINGKEGKKYDEIDNLQITLDGGKLAYAAKEGERMFIVIDEKEGKKYNYVRQSDNIWGVNLSSDGKTLVYAVRGNEQEFGEKNEFIVINGKEQKMYDWLGIQSLMVSPDGKNIIYKAGEGNKEFIVINGEEGKRYDQGQIKNLQASLNYNVIAYILEEKDGKEFSVVQNIKTGEKKEGKRYDAIHSFRLSYNGETLAYDVPRGLIKSKDRTDFVVVNGIEEKKYNNIGKLTLSFDGNNVIYMAYGGDSEFMVINGKEDGKRYKKNEIDRIEIVGNYLNNVVYIGKRNVGLDEHGNDDYKYFVGVNHNIIDEYNMITEPVFLNNNTIRYFAYDGENIYRITKTLK